MSRWIGTTIIDELSRVECVKGQTGKGRRGLTATLVREDRREGDVFALIGPKRFDVPWRDLERQSWIANATCVEERIPMTPERRMEYALASRRAQLRIAAENPAKMTRVRQLLEQHGCV
jgi:DNA excision repair protein ERCC-3